MAHPSRRRSPARLARGAAVLVAAAAVSTLGACAIPPIPLSGPPAGAAASSPGSSSGSGGDPATAPAGPAGGEAPGTASSPAAAAPSGTASTAPGGDGSNLHPAQGAFVDAKRLSDALAAATDAEKTFEVSYNGDGWLITGSIDRKVRTHIRALFSVREKSDVKMQKMRMVYVDGPDMYVQVAPKAVRYRKTPLAAAPADVRRLFTRLEDPVSFLGWHPSAGAVVEYGGDQGGGLSRYVVAETPSATGGPPKESSEVWTDAKMRLDLVEDREAGVSKRTLHVWMYGAPMFVDPPPPSLVVP